jgi:hypothetical protein
MIPASYTPEVGHRVRVQRWEVPCPEIPGTAERRLLTEMDGTVGSVRAVADGHLITLEGDDESIFTGYQFSGTESNAGPSWSLRTKVKRRIGDEPADLDALTERRKGDRAVMARYVAQLAEAYGLTAEVAPGLDKRELCVRLAGPHGLGLTVRFQGNSPQCEPDTYVLSWHMTPWKTDGYRLSPRVFEAVNPHHGCKATEVANGYRELCELLSNRFAHIMARTAFVRNDTAS